MKKLLMSIVLTLSLTISFSQLISHSSVRVSDENRQGYLELEEFWSSIHDQAIIDGYSQ